eukprot:5656438-Amphidinium_carterae.1
MQRPGRRKEIERFMITQQIEILCLQETRCSDNFEEKLGEYTWFNSSGPTNCKEYHGVGIVLHKTRHLV